MKWIITINDVECLWIPKEFPDRFLLKRRSDDTAGVADEKSGIGFIEPNERDRWTVYINDPNDGILMLSLGKNFTLTEAINKVESEAETILTRKKEVDQKLDLHHENSPNSEFVSIMTSRNLSKI